MSYIGKVELKASDIRAIAPGIATHLQTDIALNWLAPNVQSLIVAINGVKQETDSYTITGTASSTVVLGVGMTLSDTYQVIGINDIGTTITPADGTVTLQRLSPSTTGASGKYLTNDGADLSWGTVASVPDLTTEGDLYKNYKEFTSDHTTPVDANSNSFLLGPIGVSAVGSVTWTIEGDVDIL
jgi:hypothetical protein